MTHVKNRMSPLERRSVATLSGIFALRMFGLFMLLPVLALYADSLEGNTPVLMGWALGVYGLTQAIMQIPFGVLSDRIDRRAAIALGLSIFMLGSVVAACSESIYGLIAGRAIQGAGAVSAAILALVSDLTRSSQRTKAMAWVGISIGASFMLSFLLAPTLQYWIGVDGLFWGVAVLTLLAIAVLYLRVPNMAHRDFRSRQTRSLPETLVGMLRTPQLMHLNVGIFLSHMVLTTMFLVIPSLFRDTINLPLVEHWKIYLPVLTLSVPGMFLLLRQSSSLHRRLHVYRTAIGLLCTGFVLLAASPASSFWWLAGALIVFFSGFNALEAMMPSLVSRMTGADSRGRTLSLYTTFQFLGVFCGGVAGGVVLDALGRNAVFWFAAGIALTWMLLTLFQPRFSVRETLEIDLGRFSDEQQARLAEQIRELNGVEGVNVFSGESVVHLEVNPERYDDLHLQRLLGS